MSEIIKKIKRALLRFRLQPIRVFCFHQVSEEFDENSMWKCDWMQTDVFKQKVRSLNERYEFISLEEAYHHLQRNFFRFRKYAVLTADDGWESLKNIIPWLAEQNIPLTLFVNPAYMDGIRVRERKTERFLTWSDIKQIEKAYPKIISVGSHGYVHDDTFNMNIDDFEHNIVQAEVALKYLSNKIDFYAFPYGHYRQEHLAVLSKYHLIPVLMDGVKNDYSDCSIHRENMM